MTDRAAPSRFVVYLGPADGHTDLEPMKIYRLATREAKDPGDHLRVVDESGKDDLCPARLFSPIDVPAAVAQALLAPA